MYCVTIVDINLSCHNALLCGGGGCAICCRGGAVCLFVCVLVSKAIASCLYRGGRGKLARLTLGIIIRVVVIKTLHFALTNPFIIV